MLHDSAESYGRSNRIAFTNNFNQLDLACVKTNCDVILSLEERADLCDSETQEAQPMYRLFKPSTAEDKGALYGWDIERMTYEESMREAYYSCQLTIPDVTTRPDGGVTEFPSHRVILRTGDKLYITPENTKPTDGLYLGRVALIQIARPLPSLPHVGDLTARQFASSETILTQAA